MIRPGKRPKADPPIGHAKERVGQEPDGAPRAIRPKVTRWAFTIDVEDYFQVWALDPFIRRDAWDEWPRRVEQNTERLLELLDRADRKATFFILGWVAERHPALVRRIAEAGHEVASHGHDHRLASTQSAAEFRADVTRAKALLEDVSGCEVRGYRAPSFSLGSRAPWAHAILAETGHVYSSSCHPVRNDHYGDLTTDLPCWHDGVLEVPVATVRALGRSLPCGGGGYFRLLPGWWTAWGLRQARDQGRNPIVFYIHPWEIDPDQPRPVALPLRTRLRHYTGLSACARRLLSLLLACPWGRLDAAIAHLMPCHLLVGYQKGVTS